MPIIDDGLPIDEVGEWALEKHERLRKYIDITRHTRRKYVEGPSRTASYIDPFCGLGRAKVRETGQLILGSPLHGRTYDELPVTAGAR